MTAPAPRPSDLLRHIAQAREAYATHAPDQQRQWLEIEAQTFRNAADVLDNPDQRPSGLLPTWFDWPPAATGGRRPTLAPEAILTWDSVRRLETHTDIGPGNVGPLLIQVNFRQHEHTVTLLRTAGWLTTEPHDDLCAATYGETVRRPLARPRARHMNPTSTTCETAGADGCQQHEAAPAPARKTQS